MKYCFINTPGPINVVFQMSVKIQYFHIYFNCNTSSSKSSINHESVSHVGNQAENMIVIKPTFFIPTRENPRFQRYTSREVPIGPDGWRTRTNAADVTGRIIHPLFYLATSFPGSWAYSKPDEGVRIAKLQRSIVETVISRLYLTSASDWETARRQIIITQRTKCDGACVNYVTEHYVNSRLVTLFSW